MKKLTELTQLELDQYFLSLHKLLELRGMRVNHLGTFGDEYFGKKPLDGDAKKRRTIGFIEFLFDILSNNFKDVTGEPLWIIFLLKPKNAHGFQSAPIVATVVVISDLVRNSLDSIDVIIANTFGNSWLVTFMEVCRKFLKKTLDFSTTFNYTSNKRKTMNSQELREYIKTNCPNLASILTEEELNTAAEINTGIWEKLPLDPREGGELDLSLIGEGFPQDCIEISDNKERLDRLASNFFSTIKKLNE